MADETEGKTLTEKQQAFVLEYLKDHNGAAAAIRAGYSPRSAKQIASDLLNAPECEHVQDAIAVALAEQSARLLIDADNVLRAARDIRDRCMQREAVTDDEGKPLGVYVFDAKGANGANALLAKHVGIGGPNVNVNIDFDKLNEAQLEHLANGGSLGNLPR